MKNSQDDIYRDLSGSFPINILMASKKEGYFENSEHINDLFKLKEFLETLPGIDKKPKGGRCKAPSQKA